MYAQPRSQGLLRFQDGGEDSSLYRYNTNAEWSEDIDFLTLVVIGRNCLPCKIADFAIEIIAG